MTDTESSPESGKKLFFGLFIFPLLIAVGMAALLCAVVLMTHEDQTAENLLASLKKSAPSKRWQKAFELSNEINRDPKQLANTALSREMIEVLGDTERFDGKTRGYMAIALSHDPGPESAAALERALRDTEEEVRVYALWSLGRASRASSAPAVEKCLADESPEVRKTAAYVLGALGSSDSLAALQKALGDPMEDVRWNAALALARLENADGYNILVSMLERERLSRDLKLDEETVESVMTNAVKGLALIPRPESIRILETLSRQDKNMKVRQAALDALQRMIKNPS